jgi:predicted glycosyltransferase
MSVRVMPPPDGGAEAQAGWHALTETAAEVELSGRRARGRRITAATLARARRSGVRLLIYTQDGLGLGHLRRAGSVAAEFLRGEAEGSVLTISDSPLGSLIRDVPHHDYLKLPSIVKAGPGDWRPHSLPLEIGEVRRLRSRLILEAATAFGPDVLLVDHMPHGALGELLPTLAALRHTPTRIVLGVRDIIDDPAVVHARWRSEGAFDALAEHYDQVLVYGSSEVFDLPEQYGWPAELARMVRFCGYVCTPAPVAQRRLPARRLGMEPRGSMVVAMAGGGADAHALMSTLVDAVPEVCAARPCTFVIVTGPFMPDAERRDLKRRAAGLPVRLRTMVGDPLRYLAAADLVVAMAGYNTTMEVLRVGTPALLVPRRGPSAEQRMRARRFADRGWVSQLDPDELEPGRLAAAVLGVLGRGAATPVVPPPDLGGLASAAESLHAAALAARATVTAGRDPADAVRVGRQVV